MNGWQYARNGVLTLSAISYFNVIAGRVCVWHISIWWSLCFSSCIWDIWRRDIVLKENCKISLTIYDVWSYEYLVIYDLFAWAMCLSQHKHSLSLNWLSWWSSYRFSVSWLLWPGYCMVFVSWSVVISMFISLEKLVLLDFCLTGELSRLVGCPCVVTAHNNTHVNYLPERSQYFLLIVFASCMIFFFDLTD
jgi:hypothetical protein